MPNITLGFSFFSLPFFLKIEMLPDSVIQYLLTCQEFFLFRKYCILIHSCRLCYPAENICKSTVISHFYSQLLLFIQFSVRTDVLWQKQSLICSLIQIMLTIDIPRNLSYVNSLVCPLEHFMMTIELLLILILPSRYNDIYLNKIMVHLSTSQYFSFFRFHLFYYNNKLQRKKKIVRDKRKEEKKRVTPILVRANNFKASTMC